MGLCNCRRGNRKAAKKRRPDRSFSATSSEVDLESDEDEEAGKNAGCCSSVKRSRPKFVRAPRTPEDNLRRACAEGSVQAVHALLKSNVDVNAETQNGYSPLHAAAAHGRSSIVSVLISNAAQVDALSKGVTPLMLASMGGHKPVVEALVLARASVHEELRGVRGQERQAVHLAQLFGHEKVAELLKQHMPPEAKTTDGQKKKKDRKHKDKKAKKDPK
mmetsp:Transcript_18713/g.43745  ORF Transcript_18713/g.43745 Transcript_18713/m.43745 type:complete len:218 (-) Transcript_18713:67-720(-)